VGAKAAPDGYTILFAHSGALVLNPHMYENPGYDTLKDFAPVTRGTETPYILVLHPSVPANSMKELAQLAKQPPGKLTFASTSAGPQLMGELFRLTDQDGHGTRALQRRRPSRHRSPRRACRHHVLRADIGSAAHTSREAVSRATLDFQLKGNLRLPQFLDDFVDRR
jgi:Tripartite tricarboxylate transporter family receptor